MISQEEWNEFNKLNDELSEINSKIEDHITKSLRIIFSIYGKKLETWYYPNAPEGGIGAIDFNISSSGSFHIICEPYSYDEMFYTSATFEGNLTEEFPLEFLFMSLDEIKTNVTNYHKKLVTEREAKKQKRKEAKAQIKAEKKKILEKLTVKERKVLGIKE